MRVPKRAAAVVAPLLLFGAALSAQPPTDSLLRLQQRRLDSLLAVVRAMQARLDSLGRARADTAGDELAALRAAAAAAAAGTPAPASAPARLGLNALNPEITVSGDARAHAFRPGPQAGNLTAREFEFAFQSALDPYSTAKVFLSAEEGSVALEEGYVFFSALPAHLRLDVGQFRQTVGELNRWHLHAINQDEYPLVIRRYAGEDGLVAPGASLYWPVPIAGAGAYEVTMQATLGDNAVLFAGGARPGVNAQLSGFWQFTRSTFGQITVGGVRGTNPDTSLTTRLAVASVRASWRPPERAQRREFTLRGEVWALRRRFNATAATAGFDAERFGSYLDLSWRLDRRWVAGVRGDYVQSPDPGPLATEWAATPVLTFWPSEFVYVRGQYERMRGITSAVTNRLTLQVVFAMGPHKHELF